MKKFTINKKDYPEQWPFIVDKVTITNPKRTKELYVSYGFTKYNFNGVANQGLPLDQIWLDNPEIPGSKKSIGFIFGMCKKRGF